MAIDRILGSNPYIDKAPATRPTAPAAPAGRPADRASGHKAYGLVTPSAPAAERDAATQAKLEALAAASAGYRPSGRGGVITAQATAAPKGTRLNVMVDEVADPASASQALSRLSRRI